MKVICHSDGGARMKAGLAGAGAVVFDPQGNELAGRGHFMRNATTPQAEYMGLILAMQTAHELGALEVEVLMDAELVARQFNGQYRAKDEKLSKLLDLARMWARRFESCVVREFPKAGPKNKRRWANVKADALANQAMDLQADVRR